MKRILSLVLCLALLASMSVALSEQVPAILREKAMAYLAGWDTAKYVIKTPALFEKIDAGEDMLILDVRQADAYAKGHLKGAVNVPFGMAVAENLALIPDDVQVYVYCYTGQTSSQVTALLNIAGKYAVNIQSGYNNGISVTEGFEKYVDTTEALLPGDAYPVDADIQAAVTGYFEKTVAATDTAYKNNNFTPESLKEVVDAELDDYFIYSVRQAVDYEAGHIAGAVNNPFGAGMEQNFSNLPMDKKIIVYCYTGQTASQTVAVLRLLGYDAYNLQGGMGKEGGSGWLGLGCPVVTD